MCRTGHHRLIAGQRKDSNRRRESPTAPERRDGGTGIAREGSGRFDPRHSPLASVLFEVVSPFELNRAARNEFSEALAPDV